MLRELWYNLSDIVGFNHVYNKRYDMRLNISLLGPVHLILQEKPVRLQTLKGQALFYFLLTEALDDTKAGKPREFLMEILWPGLPVKSAQTNLRQAVYQLRKGLAFAGYTGPDPLLSDRYSIALNPKFDHNLDLRRFTNLTESISENPDQKIESLLEAAGLYRGDFLADFYVPDSNAFDDWARVRREHYRRSAAGLFSRMVDLSLRDRSFPAAEGYAQRLLKIDPLSEDGHKGLLLALSGLGERTKVMASYENYRKKLEEDLGITPGLELRSLAEKIKDGTVKGRMEPPTGEQENKLEDGRLKRFSQSREIGFDFVEKPHFWGREKQLQTLHHILDSVLSHQPRVALITGEAGSGKTALMQEFNRQAQDRAPHLLVAVGTCNAFTGAGDAFLPFRDVLDQLRQINRGQEETHWLPDAANKELLLEQFTRALLEKVEHNPLLIVLDDLQWADSASISLLFHLTRRIDNLPIFILGAYRSSEVKAGISDPGDGHHTQGVLERVVNELKLHYGDILIDLDSFSPVEARGFMDAFLDHDPSILPNSLDEVFRTNLFSQTRGHPLFTIELVKEMQARGDLVQGSDGRWIEGSELRWEKLPARIEAVIQQKFLRLEGDLNELLSAACVEGEEFTAQIAARVTGMEDRKALRILTHDLEHRHQLVRYDGEIKLDQIRLDKFTFDHNLYQQFLYQHLNPGERRLLHEAVAYIWEEFAHISKQDFSVKLAHHFDKAALGEKAVAYLLKAGDQARTLYAHEEAARHYQRAIQILKEKGEIEGAASALMKLGMTYHTAFDFDAARKAYRDGFRLWHPGPGQQEFVNDYPAPHPLRLRWGDPGTLDPSRGGITPTEPILTQIFSGLVAPNPDMEVVPDIATNWEMLEGGRKYVFHLRKDVFWSDGKRVTAGDFEFTYKRALNPDKKFPVCSLLLYGVRGAKDYHQGKSTNPDKIGIHCLDDATLMIELEEPVSYFLQQLSYYVLLPVPRHIVEKHGDGWAEPGIIVTNGPFQLAEWKKGEYILLERSPGYHGQFTGNIFQVMLHLGITNEEEFEKYEAGQLDLVTDWFTPSNLFEPAARKNLPDYINSEIFATFYLIINPSHSPFTDKRLRQALSFSLDRQKMAKEVFKNLHTPASGSFVPHGMPGYVENSEPAYRPELAWQLLSEAGYPQGFEYLGNELVGYSLRQDLTKFLINTWQESLNIHIPMNLIDLHKYLEYLRTQKPTFALKGWWADYADPENFLRVCVNMDLPDWNNPHYISLLEKARQTFNQSERVAVYQEAGRLLMDEAVIIPLAYSNKHLLIKPWVKNFRTMKIKHPGFWKDVIIESHD
jgi:ABC-type oligopeptide transport system substrate-binding subunit/DNA-binding SARP family transcriptional activator